MHLSQAPGRSVRDVSSAVDGLQRRHARDARGPRSPRAFPKGRTLSVYIFRAFQKGEWAFARASCFAFPGIRKVYSGTHGIEVGHFVY